MTADDSEQNELDCNCECHEHGACPKQTPMSTEMIKVAYLRHLEDEEENGQLPLAGDTNSDTLTYPMLGDLGSLFPLLSDQGLWEWARHVFGNWTEWDVKDLRGRTITRWLNEVDKRYPVPSSRAETLSILRKRDGLGCVCRRDRPECRFQRDSHYVLEDYEVAHLMPTSLGGEDVWSNLALISPSCNKSQGAKEFSSWLELQTGRRYLKWSMWNSERPTSSKKEDMISAVGFEWRAKVE